MSALDARLAQELEGLRAKNLHRVRRLVEGPHGVAITVDGKPCINFCSNDYLGLAADPRVAAAARRALDVSGTGAGAAALISGYNAEHRALEEALAEFTRRPKALLFSSGWAANLGVLRALLGRDDTLVADELNHASLIDGGRLSGARYVRVPHRDLVGFEAALRERGSGLGTRDSEKTVLVVTETVFSMDGDVAPLPELLDLCAKHGASLMVDDAHGFGVLGKTGRGTVEHFFPGSEPRAPSPDVYVATLGKALGVGGAFVAGSAVLIDYLVQRARTWVFSTAPPPALAAAARESLRIAQAEPERRARVAAAVRRYREGAAQRGIPVAASTTPIQPLILGDEARALALSTWLRARGYWVSAIRPPTVPAGTARLRVTLSAAHTDAQVDGLLDALAAGLGELAKAA